MKNVQRKKALLHFSHKGHYLEKNSTTVNELATITLRVETDSVYSENLRANTNIFCWNLLHLVNFFQKRQKFIN